MKKSAFVTKEIVELINSKLPELNAKFNEELGCENFIKFKAEFYGNGNREDYNVCEISSNSILDLFGIAGKSLWKRIWIEFTNGGVDLNGNVWFSPIVRHENFNGGMNGTDFVFDRIIFNVEKKEWSFGKKLKSY